MDFATKIEKFGLFLESVKDINPVLVESIATGFTAIVEAGDDHGYNDGPYIVKSGNSEKGTPARWSDEAYDEEMSNELDEQPLARKMPSIEIAPYVFAEVIDEDGKITIWKKGFGNLAVTNDYDYKDFDDLVAEAKVNYTKMKTTGKYNKELVDDPKEVIEMQLNESVEGGITVGMKMRPSYGVWRTERLPVGGQFARLPSDVDVYIEKILSTSDKTSKYGTCCEVVLSNGWKCAISKDSVDRKSNDEESMVESEQDDWLDSRDNPLRDEFPDDAQVDESEIIDDPRTDDEKWNDFRDTFVDDSEIEETESFDDPRTDDEKWNDFRDTFVDDSEM